MPNKALPVHTAYKALRQGKTVEFVADINERVRIVSLSLDRDDKWLAMWTHPRFNNPQWQRVTAYQEFFIEEEKQS